MNKMLIGISGKIGAGKDLVGEIIHSFGKWKVNETSNNIYSFKNNYKQDVDFVLNDITNRISAVRSNFETKRFADALKDIVCILIGCTREQLEDREFKEKELGEEWWYYFKPKKSPIPIPNNVWYDFTDMLIPYGENISMYERVKNDIKLIKLTPRLLLQLIGTECMRNIIHPNTWVNTLFSKYTDKADRTSEGILSKKPIYPKWIIPDLRFPNELQAIKDRGGITIRVNRTLSYMRSDVSHAMGMALMAEAREKQTGIFHPSETALDDAIFDYTIDNNGTIQELINQVKIILTKEGLL